MAGFFPHVGWFYTLLKAIKLFKRRMSCSTRFVGPPRRLWSTCSTFGAPTGNWPRRGRKRPKDPTRRRWQAGSPGAAMSFRFVWSQFRFSTYYIVHLIETYKLRIPMNFEHQMDFQQEKTLCSQRMPYGQPQNPHTVCVRACGLPQFYPSPFQSATISA